MATDDSVVVGSHVHILVFPYPAQGHMLPLLDLTHQLALRLQGLQITILVTPGNLPILKPLLSTHPNSVQTLVLPFPSHPKLPLGIENVKDIGNSGNPYIIQALSMLQPDLIHWFHSHPFPPHAILSDFFLGFTHHWAENLNIPRFAFFSSGAFFTCVHECLWRNLTKDSTFDDIVDFPGLPRSPSFIEDHLPSIFKIYKEGTADMEILREGFLANFKSEGYVINSFHALEGEYMDHLKSECCDKVYNVGPLNSVDRFASMERVSPDSTPNSYLLNWLEDCSDGNVLYVCFGSQRFLKKPQMEALALGLERSKTQFVWVVSSGASQNIPDGFEERTSNQGLMIKGWAPQTDILNHKAVSGFLSHCGWNSLLESIMAGIMILAWPMEADQFVNAKLLVEHTGLAVKLCEGEHTVPDSDELARIIYGSLGQDIPQKARAKAMKEKALEAVKPGGSSSTNLDALMKQLVQIGVRKT